MTVGVLLIAVSVAYLVFLGVVEAYTLITGEDTISTRLRSLRQTAPLAVVFALLAIGGLAVHFWG